MRIVWLLFSILVAAPVAAQEEAAPEAPEAAEATESAPVSDRAADEYVSRCSGCHTFGGGKLTGPDLIPSSKWPEPDLSAAIVRMVPKTGPITDDDVTLFVALLKDPDIYPRLDAARERLAQRFAATLDAPSKAEGEALFRGGLTFENGGLACVACHRAGDFGGELGPDLTSSYSKMGQLGLVSACEGSNFDVMRTAYKDHPVTKQEALHLTEYLKSVSEDAAADKLSSTGVPVFWISVFVALLVLGLGTMYQRPPKSGVRARLIQEAERR